MKTYTVYFIIKKSGHGYLNEMTVTAKNQKEAIRFVKEEIGKKGCTAFCCTCQKPVKTDSGMNFNGKIYGKYSELFNALW